METKEAVILANGSRFEIRMLTPEFVVQKWDTLSIGMEEVLKYTTGDQNLLKILDEIKEKRLTVYGGFIDGHYKGFITIFIEDVPYSLKRYLRVVHGYIQKGTPIEMFFQWVDIIKKVAEQSKLCVTTRTIREDTLGELYERLGFSKGYIEYYFDPFQPRKEPVPLKIKRKRNVKKKTEEKEPVSETVNP